ncbi:MAG: efflux RND transporter periplasmic adaptor subunit [Balneolaceae bacterium]|nr:efflux RND transporter periplasmic adaptor subunit [Balneolaceae bacterium]
MNTVYKPIPIPLAVALFAAGLAVLGCSQEQQQAAGEEELVKTVNVETETVQPQQFERYLRLVGTVETANDVFISAEVSGRIEQYFVRKGKRISKGQPILKIDDDKLLQEKARLEAQTEQAREQYERLQRVFEEDSVGSEIDIINARTNYRQSRSALESILVDIKNATVRAPFDAILEDRLLEVGEMASPGVRLVRLIGADELKVVAGVPSRFADVVNEGDRSQVWFDFVNSDTLMLPITYVGNSIDPQARTFEVEIDLPVDSRNYKVDMIANVRIRTLRADDVVVVGEEYVYQKEEGYVVYTVARNDEGRTVAREVPVRLGPSYENRVVVETGLEPGERLITVGSSFLQNNMRIEIVDNGNNEFAQSN